MRPLGYDVEDQGDRNYLLRYQNAPVAIIRPYPEVNELNRMNDNGQLPEGVLLVACQRAGAPWGILTADGRYRLFQQNPKTGAATGQWLEIQPQALSEEDRLYVGLLSPQSLRQDGWMSQWSEEARDFGDELRRGLEERISNVALPQLARGLAKWLQSQGIDINNREQLDEIGRAALTLTFRYMFVLHLEAREHLPIRDERYRRDSAATLADDCRPEHGPFDRNSVRRWHGLQKLTGMMRNGGPVRPSSCLQRRPFRSRPVPWIFPIRISPNQRPAPGTRHRRDSFRERRRRRSRAGLRRITGRTFGSHLRSPAVVPTQHCRRRSHIRRQEGHISPHASQ